MSANLAVDADVLVIGAGPVGCSIAWRLSKHKARVVVVERRHDVGCGAASANSGITGSGWALAHGSIESKLTVASNPRWEEIADELALSYNRCGSIMLARSEEEAARLPGMVEEARSNGVKTERIGRGEIARLAPSATPDALAGMLIPCEGVIDTPRVTIGYAQIAALNGVRFFFNEPVIAATRNRERVLQVHTPHLKVSAAHVVIAAGLGGDTVSRILGCEDFQMTAKRGEYLIFDREVGSKVTKILQMMPNPVSHGLMIIPTAHGGLLVGPTAVDIEDKTDTSSNEDVLARILEDGRGLMPELDERFVIKSYSGNRPHSEERLYRIEPSELAANVVQCAAIRSIGVSCSPALADHVFDLLTDQGLQAPIRHDAQQRLERPRPLFETLDCESAAEDPLGKTVVCMCEKVTAAEVHAALQSPIPARSVGGVARRTHATYGRCQGAGCGAGVAFIASLYLGEEAWEVPMGEPEATLGVGKARHV